MHAMKAVYDGKNFIPSEPITLDGQYEVIITFVEPLHKNKSKNPRILLEPDPSKTPRIGEFEGLFEVPDDFNEPLDDLSENHEPVFLSKNGERDLVLMSIEAYRYREEMLDLREKLLAVEANRQAGAKTYTIAEVSELLLELINTSFPQK